MALTVGDVLPDFGFTISDNGTGALADPSTFAVVLTAPDGSTPTVTVTTVATGLRTVTYVATMAGRYRAVGTATGNNCDGTSVLVWDVEGTSPGAIVSLADAQAFLGAPRDSDAAQVQVWLDVASQAVELASRRTWRRQTVTESYDGGKPSLNLRKTPVASITSVTESGSAVSASGYVLDVNAGILHRGTTSGLSSWLPGVQNVTVTYVAGMTDIHPVVRAATLQLLRILWSDRNGAGQRPTAEDYAQASDYIPKNTRLALESLAASGF